MTFGEKLTGLRKLGVSRQAVSRWEQGAALPDAAKLLPCARLFSVDVEWLLDEEQDGEDRLSAAEFLQGTERPSVHRDWPWYIAGGIVPRFLEFFKASGFRAAFEDKGRFKEYVHDIPVYLIVHDNPGLLGSGAHLRQTLGHIL